MIAIFLFLAASGVLSLFALLSLRSMQHYLKGFYLRREEIEKNSGLRLRKKPEDSKEGSTISAMMAGFWTAIGVAACIMVVISWMGLNSPLSGARLQGADLSEAVALTQRDLEGACGDDSTKLPVGLKIVRCSEKASNGKAAAQQGPAGDAPRVAYPEGQQ